jgi:hypothetical protein
LPPVLYAAKGGSSTTSDLYTVDPATAVGTSVGAIGHAMTGLAFDPTDGTLFGTTSPSSTANPNTLVTINTTTGAATVIGALSKTVPDIAFDSTGVLYGWNNTDARVATINKASGVVSNLASAPAFVGFASGNGLSFNSTDVLYFAPKGATGDLYTVNTASGAQSALGAMVQGTLPTSSGSIMAFAFDAGDVLYGIYNGAQLATVNVSTRTWANIGTLSPGSLWDALAWSVTPGGGGGGGSTIEGVSIAFTDSALEPAPTWTRIDL